METFFKKFFLEGEASIYTLFGTKPISAEGINFVTEKEYKEKILFALERKKIEEKEKEDSLSWALKSFRRGILIDDWNRWISFFEQYPNPPFLFAKHPTFSDKFAVGHILNVQETIWTLHKHYEVFKKQLGYDFDPVSVTMDFKNENSQFWRQVFSSDLLKGIVYGYGYKNSYFFDLMMKFESDPEIEGPRFSSLSMPKVSFPLGKFSLPPFRSFETAFNNDPVLEKYKLEQKKIQSNLNDTNFFEMVFLQLIGELANENEYTPKNFL